MALDTVDTRVKIHFDVESGLLQYWRPVIEKAYVDCQANLPGLEPDSFASLVMSGDGRAEGSNFPNFLVPAEREQYGL